MSSPPRICADRRQAEGELGDDAEVAAAAADRPEEVGVLVGAGGDDLARGRDDLGRHQVVDRQPVLAHHEADAAAGRQPAEADRVGVAGGERQAVGVRRAGEVAGGRAGLDAGDPRLGIDADRVHPRQVDHEGVVDHAEVGEAVAAAAHREGQVVVAGEGDGRRDIVGVRRAHDRQRAAVDDDRDHPAGGVVVGMVLQNQVATQLDA